MSTTHRVRALPLWRFLVTNYIGGLGYYAWHVAWMLSVLLVCLRAMQFMLIDNGIILYTPAQTVKTAGTHAATPLAVQLLAGAFALLLSIGLCVFVICLPYWIGYASRDLPRWCLRHTSLTISARTIYRTKLVGVAAVLVAAIVLLYYPGASFVANIGFFVVVAACCGAFVCFWVQYLCQTLWKLPERRVF
mgnify:CR=1 FL=1